MAGGAGVRERLQRCQNVRGKDIRVAGGDLGEVEKRGAQLAADVGEMPPDRRGVGVGRCDGPFTAEHPDRHEPRQVDSRYDVPETVLRQNLGDVPQAIEASDATREL